MIVALVALVIASATALTLWSTFCNLQATSRFNEATMVHWKIVGYCSEATRRMRESGSSEHFNRSRVDEFQAESARFMADGHRWLRRDPLRRLFLGSA